MKLRCELNSNEMPDASGGSDIFSPSWNLALQNYLIKETNQRLPGWLKICPKRKEIVKAIR